MSRINKKLGASTESYETKETRTPLSLSLYRIIITFRRCSRNKLQEFLVGESLPTSLAEKKEEEEEEALYLYAFRERDLFRLLTRTSPSLRQVLPQPSN